MLSDLEIIPNGPRREISEMEAVECASLHIESAGKIGAYAIYVKVIRTRYVTDEAGFESVKWVNTGKRAS